MEDASALATRVLRVNKFFIADLWVSENDCYVKFLSRHYNRDNTRWAVTQVTGRVPGAVLGSVSRKQSITKGRQHAPAEPGRQNVPL